MFKCRSPAEGERGERGERERGEEEEEKVGGDGVRIRMRGCE